MLRAAALAVVSLAIGASSVSAAFVTQLGTVDRDQINAADTPLTNVARLNWQGGSSYINQYTSTGTPMVGDRAIAVTAIPLVNFTNSAGATVPFPGALPNGATVIVVTEGRIFAAGNTPGIQFESGRMFIVPRDNQNVTPFNSGDPSTWGNLAAAVARYTLAPPDSIQQGNPNATGAEFDASQVNNITLNIAAAEQSQGRILFVEDPNNTGAAGLNSFVNTTTFDNLPPGTFVVGEGLFNTFNETLADPTQPGFNLNAADIGLLNAIVAASGIGPGFFATGLGAGPATNYNPAEDGTTGDFAAQVSAESSPGVTTAIPEIDRGSAASALALVVGGVLVLTSRRRYQLA